MDSNERSDFCEQADSIARSIRRYYLKYSPGSDLEDPTLVAVVKRLIVDGVIEPGKKVITTG